MDSSSDTFVVGDLRLDPGRRRVELDGRPIGVSSRSFDILHLLIAKRDRIVTKEELISTVWGNTTVEASNLTVQMSALRKALGDTGEQPKYIATLSGKGYRFIGSAESALDRLVSSSPAIVGEVQAPPHTIASVLGRLRFVMLLAGVVVITALTKVWWSKERPEAPSLSMVVMPFNYLGEDQSKAYLADAITDDLQTDLSGLPRSLVIDHGSAQQYRDKSLAEISRDFKVRYVVAGSLQVANDQVHVDVHLIDPATARHLWDHSYEGTSSQPRETTGSVVRGIISALAFQFPQIEAARSLQVRPTDPGALDLFFQARALIDREDTLVGLTQAQSLLEDSIKKQHDLVDSLALLGFVLARKVQVFDDPTEDADKARANDVVNNALKLSPTDITAQVALGRLLTFDGRCDEAQQVLRTALENDGSSADALTGLANCASVTGHPEDVIPAMESAIRVDPASPSNKRRHYLLGFSHLLLGHYREAVAFLVKAQAEDHEPPGEDSFSPAEMCRLFLIAAYYLSGNKAAAVVHYREYKQMWPNRTVWRIKGYLSNKQAEHPGMIRALDALKSSGMQEFTDEHDDYGVEAGTKTLPGGAFVPTPTKIIGGGLLDTQQFRQMIDRDHSTIILDAGKGVAVMKGAELVSDELAGLDSSVFEKSQLGQRLAAHKSAAVVVLGSGTYGTDGYNLARYLIDLGYRNLYWYRGGEEAWARTNLPCRSERFP